jgi:hypothetical protein
VAPRTVFGVCVPDDRPDGSVPVLFIDTAAAAAAAAAPAAVVALLGWFATALRA